MTSPAPLSRARVYSDLAAAMGAWTRSDFGELVDTLPDLLEELAALRDATAPRIVWLSGPKADGYLAKTPVVHPLSGHPEAEAATCSFRLRAVGQP